MTIDARLHYSLSQVEDTQFFSVRLPKALVQRIRDEAQAQERAINVVVARVLTAGFAALDRAESEREK